MRASSMRGVSTSLSYIILLSITLVLLVFTLQSFVDFQLNLKPPMETSLNASKTISDDYAAMIGITDPEVESNQAYSGPEDAEISIETYPPYTIGSAGTVTIRITNPTDNIMKIPELEVGSDLFQKAYKNIRVIYTKEYDITFTPTAAGDYTVMAKLGGEEEAQTTIEIFEEEEAEEEEEASTRLRGTINIDVEELTMDDVSGREVAFYCNYTNWTADGKGSAGVELDFGCHDNSIAVGYFTGVGYNHGGSFGFVPTMGANDASPEKGYYSVYTEYYPPPNDFHTSGYGVGWSNSSLCAKAEAHCGNFYDWHCSATAKLFYFKIDARLQRMKRLYDAMARHLGSGYSGFLFPEVCSNFSDIEIIEAAVEDESLFRVPGYELKRIVPGDPLLFFRGDKILIVPTYRDHLSLPNDFSGAVFIYLYSEHDLKLRMKLNRYWLVDWAELPAYGQFKLDITDYVIPGNIRNNLEFWIDPEVGAGAYTIRWGLQFVDGASGGG